MSNGDRQLTPEERVKISRRKIEVDIQKKTGTVKTLDDLKKELGIPKKGKRK